MKICNRAINFVQVTNDDGDVRLCSWQKDGGTIGRLTSHSMEELYNGPAATLIKERHLACNYSACNPNACPYVANENWDDVLVDVDELPKYPEELYLAYENICNYRCVMCTIPDCMEALDKEEHERKMNIIDAELRKVLPHIKCISSNGLGELFASPHTLQLLSEWKPLADPKDCRVSLETNGSLFNEKNWKKIENLGQYHLSVAITILSFNNDIYQELSGTKQNISVLEDNLKFIKQLRESGIINYLELATVVQEKNFRELPEFARRCVEEFGADYVRLRPFEPWRDPDFKDWFKDVRNEYHPYYNEYLEVMKDSYLKHPKVHDWSGGKPSGLGPEPYPRMTKYFKIIENIYKESVIQKLKEVTPNNRIVVYAMHVVGKTIASYLSNHFEYVYGIDKRMSGSEFLRKEILNPNELESADKDVTVVVSLERYEESVVDLLKRNGYRNVITVRELIGGL